MMSNINDISKYRAGTSPRLSAQVNAECDSHILEKSKGSRIVIEEIWKIIFLSLRYAQRKEGEEKG